jgi:hypothetical protein
MPQIVVRDGVVSLVDEAPEGAPTVVVRDVAVAVEPTADQRTASLSSQPTCPSLRIDGSLSVAQSKRLEFHAALDGGRGFLSAAATVERFQIDEAIGAWAQPHLPEAARQTRLTGALAGAVRADWQFDDPAGPAFDGEFHLSEGRVEDSRLPAPATNLKGRLRATRDELRIEDLRGRCGKAAVAFSVHRKGWSGHSPLALAARAENVELDQELYERLPSLLKQEWDKYRPTGVVDATLQASFDGALWRPTAALSGRQLSFESDKIAYRLVDGSGSIHFWPATELDPARLEIDLIGVGGGQPLHVVGVVTDPRPGAAGWVEITGRDLEIDGRIIAALQPKPREVITSLHPAGKFDLFMRLERSAPGLPPQSTLRLDLADVRVNYDKFPYPLRGIRGVIEARDNHWVFRDLTSDGRRAIRGAGRLTPTPQGARLELDFAGEGVPLDEDLFDALPEPVQRAWTQLKPRGRIDLTAEVRYLAGEGPPRISAQIKPVAESSQIRPEFFPYLLESLSGTINYRDGTVEIVELRGVHDQMTVRTSGTGSFSPSGAWQVRLTGLAADYIAPRADLIAALPRQLGKLIDRLQPTGSFALHDGVLEFRKGDSPISLLETQWDVTLECHQADLQCGVDLQNIYGSVRLTGQSDGRRSASAGELNLESISFRGVQFTDVQGPMWVDETQCRLGAWATEIQNAPARRVTGKVYGGQISGDAQVRFESLPQYGARAKIVGADLQRLVVERFGGGREFRGKIDADVQVGGAGYKVESLQGKGDVHVRDANIYELPLLASLLKMLKTGASDATAFTESDIQFRLQGRHIYLDRLDFLGDVVNLYGVGYTNFDQQLNLVFSGVIGRRDFRLPMVKQIVGQASGQLMRLYVDGTLAAPHVTTEALPQINQLLQQIRDDLQNPLGTAPARQADRSSTPGVAPK